eukprot:scaffold6283_cov127-Isochrysis_galbana.AAC.10
MESDGEIYDFEVGTILKRCGAQVRCALMDESSGLALRMAPWSCECVCAVCLLGLHYLLCLSAQSAHGVVGVVE